jgi:hypothetical protein
LAALLGWRVAGVGWHFDLDVKNRELTLTSTDYSDKLRIRLSFFTGHLPSLGGLLALQ